LPEELTKENLSAALDGADMVYFDVRLHETALIVAEEVIFFPATSSHSTANKSLQLWLHIAISDAAPNSLVIVLSTFTSVTSAVLCHTKRIWLFSPFLCAALLLRLIFVYGTIQCRQVKEKSLF